jgi:hypothetical protein
VLSAFADTPRQSNGRRTAINAVRLATLIFDETTLGGLPVCPKSSKDQAILQAMRSLEDMKLIEPDDFFSTSFRTTRQGHQALRSCIPFWLPICHQNLEPEEERLLSAVNRLSEQCEDDHAWLKEIDYGHGLEGYSTPDGVNSEGSILDTLDSLRNIELISPARWADLTVRSSYRGLVWERKREYTDDVVTIDKLIADGETATVDFKRRLEMKRPPEKREFAKDMSALANARATGQRYMLIGVENDGRIYRTQNCEEQDEHERSLRQISQDTLQQILNEATRPVLTVRYDVVEHPDGPVGRLEVLRHRSDIPYAVVKDDRTVVYVRREAVTQEATQDEIEEMQRRAARVKATDS